MYIALISSFFKELINEEAHRTRGWNNILERYQTKESDDAYTQQYLLRQIRDMAEAMLQDSTANRHSIFLLARKVAQLKAAAYSYSLGIKTLDKQTKL